MDNLNVQIEVDKIYYCMNKYKDQTIEQLQKSLKSATFILNNDDFNTAIKEKATAYTIAANKRIKEILKTG